MPLLLLLLPVVVVTAVFFPLCSAFENLLQAKGEVRKDRPATPLRFASPDWHTYHTTNHLHQQLQALSHNCSLADISLSLAIPPPDILSGPSTPDKHILLSELPESQLSTASDALLYITIRSSPPPSRASNLATLLHRKAQPVTVMFVFGEQGRDLLTPEIALTVVKQACGFLPVNASDPSHHLVTKLVHGVQLILVPLVNPDGRRIAEMGRRCDRTNANDVDIDSNFPSFWRHSTPQNNSRSETGLRAAVARHLKPPPSQPHYVHASAGTHPFSEPETRALRSIVQKFNPASYVSVRTGAVALTIPWDCKPELLSESQRAKLLRVTQTITAAHCTRCKTGNLYNITGRVKCGTASDYMYGTLRVPFVHTWHVYSAPAQRGDCFRRHNPVSNHAFDRITNNWANAVFNFTTAVHNWMQLEHSQGVNAAELNASRSAHQAKEQRKEALARGVPDPESEEKDNPADPKQPATNPHSANGIFSWMHNTTNQTLSSKTQALDVSGTEEFNILTAWWGVWAALLLLSTSFFVAKRHIFSRGRRRYRARASMKSA